MEEKIFCQIEACHLTNKNRNVFTYRMHSKFVEKKEHYVCKFLFLFWQQRSAV